MYSHPICSHPECNNKVGWSKANLEFNHHCCHVCSNKDPKTTKKYKDTCQRQWGVDNAFQSEEKKQKIRQTNLKNLGVENPSQSELIKQKKVKTSINHFGVENPSQSEEIKEKIKQTNLLNMGVECSFQSKNVQNKIRKRIKDLYGVEFASQSQQVKDKYKETCQEKWGVDNTFQSTEIKSKIRQTNKLLYNSIDPGNLPEFRDKAKRTSIEHYGVEYYSQSIEYHKKKKHKFHSEKYPELTFDSTWEVKVYDFCRDNNIEVEYSPDISYEYECNGIKHTYHPDFLINGKVYEVKGNQFFKFNPETGKEEMICPYGKHKYTKEQYEQSCKAAESKHQCMLKNNVLILRDKDIKNLNINMFVN